MCNKAEDDRRVSFQNNIESAPVIENSPANANPDAKKAEPYSFTGHLNKSYEGYQNEKKNKVIDGQNVSEKWKSFEKEVELKGNAHKDNNTPKIATDAPPPYTPVATIPQS